MLDKLLLSWPAGVMRDSRSTDFIFFNIFHCLVPVLGNLVNGIFILGTIRTIQARIMEWAYERGDYRARLCRVKPGFLT